MTASEISQVRQVVMKIGPPPLPPPLQPPLAETVSLCVFSPDPSSASTLESVQYKTP